MILTSANNPNACTTLAVLVWLCHMDSSTPTASNCLTSAMTSSSPDDSQPLVLPVDDPDAPRVDLRLFSDVTISTPPPPKVLDLCATPSFTKPFSILYSLFRSNELSKRAFHLTTVCIDKNPSNPTVWVYRRKLVDTPEIEQPWQTELAFTASILKSSRKNYQVWEYRRHCIINTETYNVEFEFIDVALAEDAKNYHAWAHRAWLLRQLQQLNRLNSSVVSEQFSAMEWYIRSDVRNNSAWNFRSFLLQTISDSPDHAVTPQSEVDFACDMAALAPRNESPWNYLITLFRQYHVDIFRPLSYANESLSIDAGCIAARRFLVLVGPRQTVEEARKLQEHCTLLANGIDPIRKKYWLMKRQAIESKFCSNL